MRNRPTAFMLGLIHHCIYGLRHGLKVLAAIALVCLAAAGTMAQTASQGRAGTGQSAATSQVPAGQPDLSGVWERMPASRQISITDLFSPEQPPMTPWALEKYKAARVGLENHPNEQGRDAIDPILYPRCLMPGFPRIYLRPGAMQIAQTPNLILMLFDNYSAARRIHLDRPHPEGVPPTFMGHTIGRWDGDTLVTDTVGFNDLTLLDSMGHPHSTALRVEERIRRLDQETLEIQFLFEDPKAYTRPWRGKKLFAHKPGWELLEYTICEDQSGEDWWKLMESEGLSRD